MSSIRDNLSKTLEIAAKRGEDDPTFRTRCIDGVEKLTDAEWAKLGREAQDWYNDAVDDVGAGKAPRPFPDEKEETPKVEEGGRRRRGSSDDAAAAPAKYEPKEGDEVTVVTKRGKTITGHLVEITKEAYYINPDKNGNEKDDEEVLIDKVESISQKGGGAPASDTKVSENAEVGDTVQVTTKRGKVVMGVVQELTADEVVLKTTTGEIEDFRIDRLDGPIVVKSKGSGSTATTSTTQSEGTTSRRRGSADAEPTKEDGKGKRASNEGGVSIGTRIKEIMVESLGISEDDVAKQLKKEGIEFKENTLSLNYKDMKKTLDVLDKAGKLKK